MKTFLSLVCLLAVVTGFSQVYTFSGNGNWTVATNWSNNSIPPAALPAGDTIYISPAPGNTCILNTVQTILQGAGLIVSPGANFIIAGSLNINQAAPLPNAKICMQTWATKNLDVTTYRNGDIIPQVADQAQWESLTTGAWCYYNNDSNNNAVYGKLYNWFAVNDPRGLAPAGWHVPSDTEWTMLVNNCLGGKAIAGGKMKVPGTTYWQSPNTGATNVSGFNAAGGGSRFNFLPSYPAFTGIKEVGYWWSTREIWDDVTPTGGMISLSYAGIDVVRGSIEKAKGASVRCIGNTVPIITTIPVYALTLNSAGSGGNLLTDGGTTILAKGVVWSTNPNPTVALATKTNDGAGAVTTYTSNITGLQQNTTYYMRAYATSILGTAYGNEVSFTTQAVPSVTICNQVWMKKNLDVATYRNGDTIPQITNVQEWQNTTKGGWCYYLNDPGTNAVYGKLYNWFAINDSRGLAPEGWHIPTDSEWTVLENCLGGRAIAGGKLKEAGTSHWSTPNTGATNSSGFTALPAGNRQDGFAVFNAQELNTNWWSSTDNIASGNAMRRKAAYDTDSLDARILNYPEGTNKRFGYSVRCISGSVPILTTATASAVTATSAVTGGNITNDGGSVIIARGVVWSTSANPTIDRTTKTVDGSGAGIFSSTINGLTGATNYHVRAYATNASGTGYGPDHSFTTTATVIPAEAIICDQVWMTKNLTISNYRNGDVIPQVTDNAQWAALTTGAWRWYNNDSLTYGSIYGKLYNWYAVNDPRGLAPAGWYLPSDSDWVYLSDCLGGGEIAGSKLKEAGTAHWVSPNNGATNSSGFTALPGGISDAYGGSGELGYNGHWWSTKASSNTFAYLYYLRRDPSIMSPLAGMTITLKNAGLSVRCLRNQHNIATTALSSITPGSAVSGGSITTDNGIAITARGIVWSTTARPTIALPTKTTNGAGIGNYSSILTGLDPNTTYFVRAYATNNVETYYGNQISFITTGPPVLTTAAITNLSDVVAVSGGNISLDGGSNVTARGVVWNTSPAPTTALATKTSDGTGTGSYTSNLAGLAENTTYYARAYATNSNGTAYGNELSFKTLIHQLPIVTTKPVINITDKSASFLGNVSSAGAATINDKGFAVSTNHNPTAADFVYKTVSSSLGDFSCNSAIYSPNKTYYVRAFATSSIGTGYGEEVSFTTLAAPPAIPEITICNQVWMQKNLDVTTYRNGDPIPQVTDPTAWSQLTTGAWCYYDNNSTTGASYSKLYNWYAVNDPRGLAPTGWHVPSDAELTTLVNCLGGYGGLSIAGGKMKQTGTNYWSSPNSGASNSSLFTALGAGYRYGYDGTFNNLKNSSYFWSTSGAGPGTAWVMGLFYNGYNVARDYFSVNTGLSVRCVKD